MSIEQLSLTNFRNITNTKINFSNKLNFIFGENGSGKSSILEAIFFISQGKSFRTNKHASIAKHQQSHFVISVLDDQQNRLGLLRTVNDASAEIKINGKRVSKLSDLAKNIAVQIITPESFKLFFGGPKERRRFLDLGVFHVKHEFSKTWRNFNKVYKHRNALLKNKVSINELSYWTTQFCQLSEMLADYRANYVLSLYTELKNWLVILLPDYADKIELSFFKGWSEKKLLADILKEQTAKEFQYGYSIAGAHKFDFKFLINKHPLENLLSRGQQKLFLLALTFAQSTLIANVKQVKPILLIDDIGAELDINSRSALAKAVAKIDSQVVITAINKDDLAPFINDDFINNNALKNNENYTMFHVKHGEITIELK